MGKTNISELGILVGEDYDVAKSVAGNPNASVEFFTRLNKDDARVGYNNAVKKVFSEKG